MSSALDMSLDDLIKKNKESGDGSRGKTQRGSSSASGPSRRQPNRAANRANPYASGKPKQAAPDTQWQHDMFVDQPAMAYAAPAGQSIETGTKLYISNLDYGVSNEDIKELFSEVGDLKRFSVHYDRSGRSKGTAEVVFSRRSDAVAAVKRYNNVQLDGKPMKIDLVLPNLSAVTSIPQVTNASFGNPGTNANPRSNEGRGAGAARPRGGGGGGRRGRGWSGRGRGRGAGRGEDLSVEDLDADLDKYHADAMQIN